MLMHELLQIIAKSFELYGDSLREIHSLLEESAHEMQAKSSDAVNLDIVDQLNNAKNYLTSKFTKSREVLLSRTSNE